jgi:glycosyltransferase involved in cell wall biosynthesis
VTGATEGVAADEDAVDAAARAEFAERYGAPAFGPVCVVLAAYREAGSVGPVLDELPGEVDGLPVSVLVIDDGSDDGTAEVARERGAYVLAAAHRGQGAALRLGYRVAAERGARYLVTTDADGQYDPGEIPALLAPILEDRADFVSGSRRLGGTYGGDWYRSTGVVVYAWVLRRLTGRSITDPSYGLRAMRVEVPAAVELRQPQYQTSELLIGAAARGFRMTEVPSVMRVRTAGASRKGSELLYGARFGRTVLMTWWRERRRRDG